MKSNQSQAFRHAQVYVHGLYGSAGGPFTEVVEAGDEQHAFGIAINSQVDTVAAIAETGYTVTGVQTRPYEKKGFFSFLKK